MGTPADMDSAAEKSKDRQQRYAARGPRRRNKKGRGSRAAQDPGSGTAGMHSDADALYQRSDGKGGPADSLQPWPPSHATAAYGGQPIVPGLGSLPNDSAWPHPKVSHVPQCHITQDQGPDLSCRHLDVGAVLAAHKSMQPFCCPEFRTTAAAHTFFPRPEFKTPAHRSCLSASTHFKKELCQRLSASPNATAEDLFV